MTATDKPRADLVALLLLFEQGAGDYSHLHLTGADAGAAVAAWAELRGHHLQVSQLTRPRDGKTVGWTRYEVSNHEPRWTVTAGLHDEHEVDPAAQADQQVLKRVQDALDGEQRDEDGNRIMDPAEVAAREGIEQPEAAEGSV